MLFHGLNDSVTVPSRGFHRAERISHIVRQIRQVRQLQRGTRSLCSPLRSDIAELKELQVLICAVRYVIIIFASKIWG